MCACLYALKSSGKLYGSVLVDPLSLFVLFALFALLFERKKDREEGGRERERKREREGEREKEKGE